MKRLKSYLEDRWHEAPAGGAPLVARYGRDRPLYKCKGGPTGGQGH